MKKKKLEKKEIKKEPQGLLINLNNVFPFIVQTIASLDRRLDALQKTVDAIGLMIADKK